MKTADERKAEREAKQNAREAKAQQAKMAMEALGQHGLSIMHLREGKGLISSLNGMPLITIRWHGEDVTVASVKYDGGRLFTIARVNVKAGDRFCRAEGRRVAVVRLLEEKLLLESNGTSFQDKDAVRCWDWFYWSTEIGGRDTMMTLNMLAAAYILANQLKRKHGVLLPLMPGRQTGP